VCFSGNYAAVKRTKQSPGHFLILSILLLCSCHGNRLECRLVHMKCCGLLPMMYQCMPGPPARYMKSANHHQVVVRDNYAINRHWMMLRRSITDRMRLQHPVVTVPRYVGVIPWYCRSPGYPCLRSDCNIVNFVVNLACIMVLFCLICITYLDSNALYSSAKYKFNLIDFYNCDKINELTNNSNF